MPLLFAATLFVSASLLFMVQPMVGKMVLPLLGGSPAVWNACMVFFQALLLLGYLYAHFVAGKYEPKKQWMVHLVVLTLPIGAFLVAVLLGARHSPIAIAESLAPTGESSPILSVLALLTVAIAIPFFVVSTSAPLLQKWFAYTGHPDARDPYFLYAASNFGSMISLLGYPLFIEPNLSIVGQAWLFAVGFGLLAIMVYFCGQAAANPIGVPPPAAQRGKHNRKNEDQAQANESVPALPPTSEPSPSWARKLKWIALAFVPSSLMLGVTFHMSTDIASIPLMWVIPLALYLVTFIIAFGTLRGLLKLLLLVPAVSCLMVGLLSTSGVLLLISLLFTIIFVALQTADWGGLPRISLADSTAFRMIIGNLAPVMILLLIFTIISGVLSSSREPRVGLELFLHVTTFFAVALMCHYELARDRPSAQHLTEFFLLMSFGGMLGGVFNSLIAPIVFVQAYEYKLVLLIACLMVPKLIDGPAEGDTAAQSPLRRRGALALDFIVPLVLGVAFYYIAKLPGRDWYALGELTGSSSPGGGPDWFKNMAEAIHNNLKLSLQTIIAVLIYAVPVMVCFFFVDRPLRFALCAAAILAPTTIREANSGLIHTERSFFGILKIDQQRGHFNRLVHGTTLHGTQFNDRFQRHYADDFQMLVLGSPWDILAVTGANATYNPRQDPLTYYHRSGPVGAMFRELYTRKNGADRTADVAMVGLGTGSVACYAQKGQRLTFYEIDPAVKHLVADTDQYFTFVSDARARGADVEIRMGDARLKLKEDTNRKYSLLLVDAFSSDAIPVHLLTREAVELYLNRMPEDGILALHISNKFVSLEPVVAQIVSDLRSRGEFPDLAARLWSDSSEKGRPGKTASSWIVLARNEKTLGTLALSLEKQREDYGTSFRPLLGVDSMPTWTDDYSDVMRVMTIPEIQKLRRFFGLPTLKDGSDE